MKQQTNKQTLGHIQHICDLLGYKIVGEIEGCSFRIINKIPKDNIISSQILSLSNNKIRLVCVSYDPNKKQLYALYVYNGVSK